jgi:hypothetical protein
MHRMVGVVAVESISNNAVLCLILILKMKNENKINKKCGIIEGGNRKKEKDAHDSPGAYRGEIKGEEGEKRKRGRKEGEKRRGEKKGRKEGEKRRGEKKGRKEGEKRRGEKKERKKGRKGGEERRGVKMGEKKNKIEKRQTWQEHLADRRRILIHALSQKYPQRIRGSPRTGLLGPRLLRSTYRTVRLPCVRCRRT